MTFDIVSKAALVVGGLLAADAASASVVYIQTDSTVNTDAFASWNGTASNHPTGTQTQTNTAAPTTITATNAVNASSSANAAKKALASDSETTTVSLSDPTDGFFSFSGATHAHTLNNATSAGNAHAGDGGNVADYYFNLDNTGDIALSWSSAGNNSSAAAYTIELKDLTTNTTTSISVATTSSGNQDINLAIGDYELIVTEASGTSAPDYVSVLGANHNLTGSAAGTFNFEITSAAPPAPAVPEPSTWAMMGLGFMGLGFAGWRRTRLAVALELRRYGGRRGEAGV